MLFDRKGNRFCNEVGTRAYVTGEMLSQAPSAGKMMQTKGAPFSSWSCHLTLRRRLGYQEETGNLMSKACSAPAVKGQPGLTCPVSQAFPSGTEKGTGIPAMIPWTTVLTAVEAAGASNLMTMEASVPLGRRQGALVHPLTSTEVTLALDPQSLKGEEALATAKVTSVDVNGCTKAPCTSPLNLHTVC